MPLVLSYVMPAASRFSSSRLGNTSGAVDDAVGGEGRFFTLLALDVYLKAIAVFTYRDGLAVELELHAAFFVRLHQYPR